MPPTHLWQRTVIMVQYHQLHPPCHLVLLFKCVLALATCCQWWWWVSSDCSWYDVESLVPSNTLLIIHYQAFQARRPQGIVQATISAESNPYLLLLLLLVGEWRLHRLKPWLSQWVGGMIHQQHVCPQCPEVLVGPLLMALLSPLTHCHWWPQVPASAHCLG
jgi:hypothetical protein